MKPYAAGYLPVSHGHTLYYAEYGNPHGIPLLFMHGGPGSGCNPEHAKLLHPQGFRIIQVDQRGCGLSTPRGWLLGNTTTDLVADMETLRLYRGIERWVIYGGSWGATLALEYAKYVPENVLGLLLRGAFLARQEDWQWFSMPDGVAQQFPQAYQQLVNALHSRFGENPITTLYPLLTDPDASLETAYRAALAWDSWESAIMGIPPPVFNPASITWSKSIERLRVYSHYAYHDFFLPPDGVLPDIDSMHAIPVVAIHGIHDKVCRFESVQALKAQLPELTIIPVTAGHGLFEHPLQEALSKAAANLHHLLVAT